MPRRSIHASHLAITFSGFALYIAASAYAQVPKPIVPKAPVSRAVSAPARGVVVHPVAVRHVNPVVVHPHPSENATREAVRVEHAYVTSAGHNAPPGGIIVIAGSSNGRYPRLHAALDALIAANQTMRGGGSNADATTNVQRALHELSQSSSNPLFQGHRQGAIDRSIRAVHLLEKGAAFDEPATLTRDAIDDLRFCVSVP